MAKHEVLSGQTDYSVLVFIPDSAQTDGSGKTGLVAANLTVSYVRVETDNDVTVTDATGSLNNLAALTSAHADWGLLEVSSTVAPGLYRLDIADAVFAAGAWSAVVYVMVTTSAAAASPMEFVMVPNAPLTGVLLAPTTHTSAVIPTVSAVTGLTASDVGAIKTKTDFLPSVTAGAAGGVFIAGTNAATTITTALTTTFTGNLTGSVASCTTLNGIAANVITAASMAADAGAEIADAVWDEDATGHQTQGSFGQAIGDPVADTNTIYKAVVTDAAGATVGVDVVAVKAETAAIVADTNELQTDWTNGGRLDLILDIIAADTTTDIPATIAALNNLSATAVENAVWDALIADHLDVGSTGEALSNAGAAGTPPTVGEIADAVWDEDATAHQGGGSFGQAIGDPGADTNTIFKAVVTDAAGATVGVDVVAVKAETAAILVDTGTTLDGKIDTIDTNVDSILVDTAEIGAAGAGLTAINLPDQTMNITGNITGNLSGSVGSVTGAVGSVTAGVTLAASAVQAIWDALTAALTTAGSIGKLLVDNINATISSRASQTSVDDLPTNAELATALATADDAVLAAIAALNNLSAAQVNAEVVDALATDTYAEPTGVPAATATLAVKIGRLHQALRNAVTVTATKKQFFDDGAAALWEKDLSDDGVTYTESEGNAP